MVRAHKEDVGERANLPARDQPGSRPHCDGVLWPCAATRDGIRRSHSPHASAHAGPYPILALIVGV